MACRPGVDSWDKQYVRNWLLVSGWDREPPGPEVPAEIVAGTSQRYREVFQRITGRPLINQSMRSTMEATA